MPSLTATSVDGQLQVENAFGIPLVRGNAEAKGLTVGWRAPRHGERNRLGRRRRDAVRGRGQGP